MRFLDFFTKCFIQSRQSKKHIIIDTLPCIVTVIEIDPITLEVIRIVFQNKASIAFYSSSPVSTESLALLTQIVQTTSMTTNQDVSNSRDSKMSIVSRKMSHIRKSMFNISNRHVWHQVTHHVLKPNMLVIHQNDMTELVTHSDMLQHTLSGMLPDHVIGTLRMSYASHTNTRESMESDTDDVERLRIVELNATTANTHEHTTIMFCDIVGFTSMADSVSPMKVMQFINEIFSMIDCLTKQFKVRKIETAGDCYIAVSGVVQTDKNKLIASSPDAAQEALDATKMFDFSKAIMKCITRVKMPDTENQTRVRIGLHSGPVVSGLVGNSLPKFGLFGDTMNVAARMEQTAPTNSIQMSEKTYFLCDSESSFSEKYESFEKTSIHVKGKPNDMTTYIWRPQQNRNISTSQSGSSSEIDLDAYMKQSIDLFSSQT